MELSERRLQQVLQNRYCPRVHPLLHRFGRHLDRLFDLRRFGGQLG